MKLRTEMLRGPCGMTITAGYSEGKYSAREHDAMAAHAYNQAIAEWWDRPPEADSCTDAAVMWIEQRAAEILAGWMGE